MSAAAAPTPAIALRDVRVDYGPGSPTIVCPALDVGPGVTLVVGPNGAGKSSVLRVAAGVERPRAGSVRVRGRDLWRDEATARRPIAYVPEHPELSSYAAVGEVVRLAARLRGATDDDADAALDRAGLGALSHRTVRELSMGQRRRALLAAAFVGAPPPDVLVLDEPLESMDARTRALVAEWVRATSDAGGSALVATHDLAPFADVAVAAVVVRDGVAAPGPRFRRRARRGWRRSPRSRSATIRSRATLRACLDQSSNPNDSMRPAWYWCRPGVRSHCRDCPHE